METKKKSTTTESSEILPKITRTRKIETIMENTTTQEPTQPQQSTSDSFEQVKGKGKEAFDRLKEVVKEGNVRSVIIKSKEGKTIAEFPLTLGVIGLAVAPVVAAIGTIAALVTECSIYVEKR